MGKFINIKQALTEMGVYFPTRHNKNNKSIFLNFIINQLNENKIPNELIEFNNPKSFHLSIGNVEKADKIILANYDTSNTMLMSNYLYTPLDAKKVMTNERKNATLYAFTSLLFILAIILLTYNIRKYSTFIKIVVIIVDFVLAFIAYKFASGLPKKMNMNNNSAAIALLYKIVLNNNLNNKAIILFDKSAMFSTDYKQLRDIIDIKDKEILILDCIGSGENIYLYYKNKSSETVDNLVKRSETIIPKALSEEDMRKTTVGMFSNPILVFSGDEIKNEIVVKDARIKMDYKINLENLEKIEKLILDF